MADADLYGVARTAPTVDHRPTCWRCERALALYLARPWSLRCHRCHAQNRAGDPPPPPAPTSG